MSETIIFGVKQLTTGLNKVSVQGAYPAPVLLNNAATYSSNGVLVTVANACIGKDISPGDWLYSAANNQFKRVVRAGSDGASVILESPFINNVVAGTPLWVVPLDFIVNLAGYSVSVTGANTAIVNGISMDATDPILSYSNDESVQPFAYDASGTELTIAIMG